MFDIKRPDTVSDMNTLYVMRNKKHVIHNKTYMILNNKYIILKTLA